MATDFNRIRQLVSALIEIQHMQASFAQTGAEAPTISIVFAVDHPQVGTPASMGDPNASPPVPPSAPSADYKPAWKEQFQYNLALPIDVAAAAATALGSAVTSAMGAMNLPTS